MRQLILLLSLVALLQAGFDKVATTAAPFLKMGVGARALAMGSGFVALADDASALYWNPAGMASSQGIIAMASHNDWMLDIAHDYVGVILPGRRNERFGLSITSLTMGDQPVRTLEEPEGTGLTYGVMDLAISAAYARQITDRLSFGLNGKFIQLTAYNETATTMALDIGSILRTDFHGLRIGMALYNFGGDIRFSGRDLIVKSDIDENIDGNYNSDVDLRTEPWPLPLMIRIGISMDLIGVGEALFLNDFARLTLALDADHPNDGPEHLNLGAEFAVREILFVRGGYRFNADEIQLPEDDEGIYNDLESWSLGAGVKLDLAGLGQIRLDYAVKPMAVFGNSSIFSIEFRKK
ncbi:MAG: PorV/PorQ family protein [Candidatus Marinimicrobia bacterium]|nr:PorV/PorQ family protein [Candidatus Neomarinimicrobiota bacterium]